MSSPQIEHLSKCRLGEAVVWSTAEQAVYWTDIFGKVIFRKKNQGGTKSWILEKSLTSLGFTKTGELVGTFVDGLYKLDLAYGAHQLISSPALNYDDVRFNDGAVDTYGYYWAGTMHMLDPVNNPVGQLFRFHPNQKFAVQDYGFHVPDGPCFSKDGKWMFHTDTLVRQTIFKCELTPNGEMLSRRRFVQIQQQGTYPDGMTLDAEGNLWVALWGGWGVNQYSPDGKLIKHIRLPVSQVTKCIFGGADMNTLFITSASEYLQPEDVIAQPIAGALFSSKTNTQGYAENAFSIM